VVRGKVAVSHQAFVNRGCESKPWTVGSDGSEVMAGNELQWASGEPKWWSVGVREMDEVRARVFCGPLKYKPAKPLSFLIVQQGGSWGHGVEFDMLKIMQSVVVCKGRQMHESYDSQTAIIALDDA